MNPAARLMRAQAQNNAWANHRLLNACAALTQVEWEAPRSGFFPSLRATLNHILIIDHFYVDALEGGRLGPAAFAERMPCRGVAELQAAQAAVDRRLFAFCDALDDAALDRIIRVHRGQRIQQERCDRLLLHIFQHGTHHRGQAHAMLSQAGVKPPQLDEFYSRLEAPLRAAECQALGFSEADLWPEDMAR